MALKAGVFGEREAALGAQIRGFVEQGVSGSPVAMEMGESMLGVEEGVGVERQDVLGFQERGSVKGGLCAYRHPGPVALDKGESRVAMEAKAGEDVQLMSSASSEKGAAYSGRIEDANEVVKADKSWAEIVDQTSEHWQVDIPPLQCTEVNEVRFTSIGKGIFLIRATTEEAIGSITSPGRWVAGRTLIANRWAPGMLMKVDSLNRVRLWICLLDFPAELWIPRIFQDIAEAIGAGFVEANEYTRKIERYGFARIKIEVPLAFQPVAEFELEVEQGRVIAQVIEYEAKVRYCRNVGPLATLKDLVSRSNLLARKAKISRLTGFQ